MFTYLRNLIKFTVIINRDFIDTSHQIRFASNSIKRNGLIGIITI